MTDLPFDPDPLGRAHGEEPPPDVHRAEDGLTLEMLAAEKGLDPQFLRSLGVADGIAGARRRACVDIPYVDAAGEVRSVQKRISLGGDLRFLWRRGDHPTPYGLQRLPPAGATVIIVEGPSDCWALWFHRIGALGLPGASTWRSEYAPIVADRRLFVWQEPGTGGRTFVDAIVRDLPDVRIIQAPDDAKDPSALHLLDPEAFPTRLRELMTKARLASERLDAERQAEADDALVEGRELLDAPDLIDRVGRAIIDSGYAGDLTPPLLAYLALTSRCLGRPQNLAYIASPAAGKNRAIDAVLPLFPDEAYVLMKAGSARALVYAEYDYAHRTVIVAEADSIPEDGPAASAVRALAADNSMEYDVVERDEATGKFTVRHIVKPGPTGLITTSTRALGEQMSTRMLSVSISDTPEQTRAVLHAHAAAANGATPTLDAGSFVAAQRWLGLAGTRDVVIPFAHVLADAVPAQLVRMRRDFRALLTTIETVAFLYQRQRDRDTRGRIVATFDDYAIARRRLLDAFTAVATGGLTAAVREAATAVFNLCGDKPEGVRVVDVAHRLGLHKNTAWYRVRLAIRLGLIVNRETRKGQPALLVRGEVEVEAPEALPTVEALASRVCTSPAETAGTVEPPRLPGGDVASASGSVTVQTAVEPPAEPLEDSADGGLAEPVQRSNGNPGETHPYLDVALARFSPEIRAWLRGTVTYAFSVGMPPAEAWRIGVVDVLSRFADPIVGELFFG